MDNNKNENKNIRKKQKKKFKAWKAILLMLVLIVLVAAGALGGIVLAFVKTAPPINLDSFTNLAQTTKIYDKDGNYIESLHGVENRTYVPLSKIKKYTQDAFVAIEDERFYDHFGIDIKRIFGALWADIKAGAKVQGASTITQQLIKNVMLTPDKKWSRKIQEAYLAINLEQKLSKEQILEYYLNTIFLGGSANGIQAAAEYYFDKNVEELTIAESALIAGLNQSPSRYNPYRNVDSPQVYRDRTMVVLSKMLEHEMITNEEYEQAKEEVSKMNKDSFKKRSDNTELKYQWFIEAAIDSVSADLQEKYRFDKDEILQKIYSGGLRIYTTIDTNIQEIVERIANDPKYYPELKDEIAKWGADKVIQPQIAVVINEYKTGEVRAILGGRGKQPQRSINRAADPTYARQPGSSMKPLAVYGPAFDMGYSPATVIDDSPFTEEMKAANGGWNPKNFGNTGYQGLTTIREAVRRSLNVTAAKLMLEIGPGNSIEYLKKFGLSTLVLSGKKNDTGPAIALGGLTKGVIPLEMSAAYGVFGNGGIYTEPILYTRVEDSQGNVLLEKTPERHEVMSPQAAYLTTDVLLTAVNSGTGSRARLGKMPAAGKTGTTNDQKDAYFVGFTPYYSGAIWMGHDGHEAIQKSKGASRTLSSSDTAEMWGDIMKEVHKNLEVKQFERPSGLTTASVCKDSGKLATDLCERDQRGSRVITDLFIKGTVPNEFCDMHVEALVDTSTGMLANEYCPPEYVKSLVFVKRGYAVDENVGDAAYQVPTEICTQHNEYNWTPGQYPNYPNDDDDNHDRDDDRDDDDSGFIPPWLNPFDPEPATP